MGRRAGGFRRASGELESEVLAVLWSAGAAATATEVQRRVDGALAYTTVVTILTRLHEKGVVSREKQGRAFAYAPVDDDAGLVARRMRKVLDTGPDRGMVLARFVSSLSDGDEQVLRTLLDDVDRD